MICPLKAIGQIQKDYIGLAGLTHNSVLPANWSGGMGVGDYLSLLFPPPSQKVNHWESQFIKTEAPPKSTRSLQIGDWKDDKWPPECIIR